MKLTIIPIDEAVYIDELCYMPLSWKGTPETVHALQWKDTEGWIEYEDVKVPNEIIKILPSWANNAIESWTTANTEHISNIANTSNI